MNKIKKGDEVVVIAGKDRGKKGKVLEVRKKSDRLVVEGINSARKHVKANPQLNERGGIAVKFLPIHVSNVQLSDPTAGKGSRVGIRTLDDGRKSRYFKASGERVDV